MWIIGEVNDSSSPHENDSGLEPDYCLKQIRSKFTAKINNIFNILQKK